MQNKFGGGKIAWDDVLNIRYISSGAYLKKLGAMVDGRTLADFLKLI